MLLSSTAEAMYWTGRYFERAQALARVLLGCERLALDSPDGEEGALSALLGLVGCDPEGARDARPGVSELRRTLVLDAQNPSSVRGALGAARENLRSGRTLMPAAVWAPVNRLYARLGDIDPADGASVLAALDDVEATGSLVEGQLSASMTRDAAYAFWRIGCYVERADMLLRTLSVLVPRLTTDAEQRFADVRWIGVLESIGAYAMYRRRHHTHIDVPTLLKFVLDEPSFPRSVQYLVHAIEQELDGLPRPGPARDALAACALPAALEPNVARFATLAATLMAALEQFGDVFGENYFPVEHATRAATSPASIPELPVARDPFEHLGREHAAIEAVLRLLDEMRARAACGQEVDRSAVRAIVDFFTDFGVLGHHEKEEQILIPALVREGFAWHDGPLASMRNDHRQEHYFLRVLTHLCGQEAAWSPEDHRRFLSVTQEFVPFLRAHMRLEQREVFEPGARLLGSEVKAALARDLCRFDAQTAGGVRAAALRLDSLLVKYGVACRASA
ncbi:MAG TPA: alpha-E domain-containing protein [Polyangiaceae bacterium]|nr:alpha-E domain-containing protein [Polyangiaceae bacterium]